MDKLFAILGDIHANLEALEVVLADAQAHGVTDYLCTGDVVGYNASPHECLSIIRDLGCPIMMGNHDYYVSTENLDLRDFNPNAAAVINWTKDQLSDEEKQFLHDLPFVATKMGIALVHATMDNPKGFGYVFDHQQAQTHFPHQVTPICFHGHTHCPIIYEKQLNEVYRIEPADLPSGDGSFKLVIGRKYFINVGSVGQPRDRDPRAAYVLYNPKERTVIFRRLEYDIEAAQAKVRAAGLPERLAVRLEYGE